MGTRNIALLFLSIPIQMCSINTSEFLNTSSQITQQSSVPLIVNYEYSDVSSYSIKWNAVFSINSSIYYVYFYSKTCSHCQNLKNWIISYALKKKNVYFCESSNEIVFSSDVTFTVGAKSVDELSIIGFPSLIEIKNKVVTKNIGGGNSIQQYLISK